MLCSVLLRSSKSKQKVVAMMSSLLVKARVIHSEHRLVEGCCLTEPGLKCFSRCHRKTVSYLKVLAWIISSAERPARVELRKDEQMASYLLQLDEGGNCHIISWIKKLRAMDEQ